MGTIFSNCIEKIDHSERKGGSSMTTNRAEDHLDSVKSAGETPSIENYDEIIKRAQAMHHSLDWIQSEPHTSNMEDETNCRSIIQSLVYKDYRGFVMGIHPQHGLLMLHCTRKKRKPPHYQLPGGHVDREEIESYIGTSGGHDQSLSSKTSALHRVLYKAARAGCARELWEETGIDLRTSMDRLWPLVLAAPENEVSSHQLINEFKDRLFFVAHLSDSDFFHPETDQDHGPKFTRAQAPIASKNASLCTSSPPLFLKLSVEHSGFAFESKPLQAVKRLELHSGGKVSKALVKAYSLPSIVSKDK